MDRQYRFVCNEIETNSVVAQACAVWMDRQGLLLVNLRMTRSNDMLRVNAAGPPTTGDREIARAILGSSLEPLLER